MSEGTTRRESIRHALAGELDEHPAYEVLEQYIDGTIDDVTREIVASHREICATCDAEVRDLMAFTGRSSSTSLRWLTAAAAVIALSLAGVYLMRTRPVEQTRKPAVRESAPRSVAATGYGRDDWNAAVRDALAHGTIAPPAILASLRPTPDVLRAPASPSGAAIMIPAGVVIDTPTPLLTWRAEPGRFVVSVSDGFKRVAQSGVQRSREWRVEPALARGRTYTWQVEIQRGASMELLPSPPAPATLFHVLDQNSSATLAEARRRFPNDHLLLGVLHARFGLQQTAVEELRRYAAQHPEVHNATALADSVSSW
jgi:hypothetical protein